MFWNWVAVALTLAGGLIFARAYLGRGGFALAVVLHAVCGWLILHQRPRQLLLPRRGRRLTPGRPALSRRGRRG